MIDIAIVVFAYFLVSRIARGKGFRGPVPGIVAALSFPAGILLGAVLFTIVSPRPYHYTVRGFYLPLIFQDLAYTIPVLIGLLLLAMVTFYFLHVPRRTPSKLVLRKSRFPFGFLGVLIVLFGVIILIAFGTSYLWSFLGFFLFFLGAKCFGFAKRRRARSAEHVLAKDKRQPVLFLRSFSSEAQLTKSPGINLLETSALRLPWAREKSWEEKLLDPFSRCLGPVIALGNPDDYLPQLGAARTYPADSNWFDVFESFAQKASCVMILPDVSDGLMRELTYIRQNVQPARVMLLEPTLTSDWSHFTAVMNEAGFEMSLSNPTAGSVYGFTSQWVCYCAAKELATPAEYATAVTQALSHGPNTEFTGSAAKIEKRRRKSKAYALGWWLAATVHKVWSLLRPGRSGTRSRRS